MTKSPENTTQPDLDITSQETTPVPTACWLGQQASHLRLRRWIGGVVLGILASLQPLLFLWLPDFYPLSRLFAVLVLMLLVALAGLWYTGAAFRRYGFCLDDTALRIRQGVCWRKETAVPLNRVQHTDIIQGPLQRHYGLARLVIHTAGTRHALVNLEGITRQQALTLRQTLAFDADSGAV